ncbi:hypothetical protein RHGRI_028020 [Rhododendron griersonianum]|uniref:Uncharacterized protein n=1 Tax=Rhododendron griersonianum TaxID=479676 RepID=A0AAV6IGH0_9ERIC|nr:hypothetical protein RHGRI_028020 [Rhododendron griersonianum]
MECGAGMSHNFDGATSSKRAKITRSMRKGTAMVDVLTRPQNGPLNANEWIGSTTLASNIVWALPIR